MEYKILKWENDSGGEIEKKIFNSDEECLEYLNSLEGIHTAECFDEKSCGTRVIGGNHVG